MMIMDILVFPVETRMLLLNLPSATFFSVSSADTNEAMAATAKEIDTFDMITIKTNSYFGKMCCYSVLPEHQMTANKNGPIKLGEMKSPPELGSDSQMPTV
jgi:flagellar basal body rod protein FlgF